MTELPSGHFLDLNEVVAMIYYRDGNGARLFLRHSPTYITLVHERDTLFVRNFLREKGKNEPR